MNKTWIWVLVVVIILIVIYFAFAGKAPTVDNVNNTGATNNGGNDLYYNDQTPNIANESALDASNSPIYATNFAALAEIQ